MLAVLFTAVLIALLGLLYYAARVEPRHLRVTAIGFAYPGLPEAFEGMRCVVFSDAHVARPLLPPERLDEVVYLINSLKPDVVLLLGDYVTTRLLGARYVEPEEAIAPLARLTAPHGVFAVVGDHDSADWRGGAMRVQRTLEACGITVLMNDTAELTRDGQSLWLAGLEDLRRLEADLSGTTAAVPEGAAIILLSHNPDIFAHVPERIKLTLCGHTHGGQVVIPRLGNPAAGDVYKPRYVYGWVREGARWLFTTAGYGMSILPLRLNAPPEIALLTLSASEDDQAHIVGPRGKLTNPHARSR